MGQSIDSTEFKPQDYQHYNLRLQDNLKALREMLDRPDFGKGPGSLGAELEVYIMDQEGLALGKNTEIQDLVNDPLLTLELNRFNLEYNFKPEALSQSPFSGTENQMLSALHAISEAAKNFDARIVPIGILPTLRFSDFGPHTMSDRPRYHALKARLQEIRGDLFSIRITGEDELLIHTNDITLEGANTSFQIHYRVNPKDFADSYNSLQLITPLVLGLATNSPTAFGQRLWHETRIPLFKKSIDCRKEETLNQYHWHQPSRVNFGHGWLRQDAYELFAETVRLYPPLLPIVHEEEPFDMLQQGKIPRLSELKLQQSTVWLWNRPVYDHADGGHLRIELRFLPSGPTAVDMTANAAWAIGLMEGIKPRIQELITALPFHYADYNFYRAAQYGLDAKLVWPDTKTNNLQEQNIRELMESMLELAKSGLDSIGLDSAESDKYLGVIERRIRAGQTGSRWQLACYDQLKTDSLKKDPQAMHRMLEAYYLQAMSNVPVSQWNFPG